MLNLAFSRVSNQSLAVSESHIGRGGSVPLIICNDLHLDESLVSNDKNTIKSPSHAERRQHRSM